MKRSDAKHLYEDFTGRESTKDFTVELSQMDNLTYLGKAVAIEYEAEKHRDRKSHVYRHEFESPAIVATNGHEILLIGEKIRITKRGIEG